LLAGLAAVEAVTVGAASLRSDETPVLTEEAALALDAAENAASNSSAPPDGVAAAPLPPMPSTNCEAPCRSSTGVITSTTPLKHPDTG
jgi:hypothetical protein